MLLLSDFIITAMDPMAVLVRKADRVVSGTTQTHPVVLHWEEVDSFFRYCVTVKVDRYLLVSSVQGRRLLPAISTHIMLAQTTANRLLDKSIHPSGCGCSW